MESRIVILEESVANQIAAGEVIERPASVVKELVENCLDAGATQIEVELESGGLKLIRITDNGLGMNHDEVVIALQRHATSKIRSADDLFSIHTLGFRGEALPSIASVSRFEIISKCEGNDSGVRLLAEGGEIVDLKACATPQGTRITVSNLFYNTPARLKFMKTQQTELGHILDLISRLALCHHTVSFKVIHDRKQVFASQGSPQLFNAIVSVYGRDVAREMIPIKYEDNALKISGFTSRPGMTRSNRSQQSLFVNGRFVKSRVLTRSVDDAYHTLVTVGRFPITVALVEIDPRLVDVNVHPTKVEVRFLHEWDVHDALLKAIRQALSGGDLIPRVDTSTSASPDSLAGFTQGPTAEERASFQQLLGNRFGRTPDQPFPTSSDEVQPLETLGIEEAPTDAGIISASSIFLIGQLHNMYLLAQAREGMVLIDQHAAHERILLEQFMEQRTTGHLNAQRLLVPHPMQLNHREAVAFEPYLPTLNSLGFEIEPFGGDCFLVRAVPVVFGLKNPETALRDVVDDLCDGAATKRVEREIELETIKAVCKRAAIKAGDKLSGEEMRRLVSDLFKAKNPYTCAHGRPTMVILSLDELLNRFKRT